MKILFIEDNEQMGILVGSLLRGHGFQVDHFSVGRQGIERFRQDPDSWDAVILDLELPDMPGKDLIPEMARLCPRLPIIIYSGSSGMHQVRERFELHSAGASALLAKPCGGKDLLDVLNHLIEIPPVPVKPSLS